MSKSQAGISILLVAKNLQNASSLVNYLNAYKYKVWTASSTAEVEQKIKNCGVEIVFFSSAFPDLDYQTNLIRDRFEDLPVVQFAEDLTKKLAVALQASTHKLKIDPPNHNSKFLNAIRTHARVRESARAEMKRERLIPEKARQIAGSEIPAGNGRWVCLDEKPREGAANSYKLVMPRGSESVVRYYFEGTGEPGKPEAVGTYYAWGRVVQYTVTAEGKTALTAAEQKSLTEQLEKTDETIGDYLSELEVINVAPRGRLERCMREVATRLQTGLSSIPGSNASTSRYLLSLIKTDSEEGFLISAVKHDELLESTAFSEFTDQLSDRMTKTWGAPFEISPPLLLEQPSLQHVPWEGASKFFTVTADSGLGPLSYFFIFSDLSGIIMHRKTDTMFSVPTNILTTELNLTFDVHLHLPANNKFLLYRRAGTEISPAELNHLNKHKHQAVFVPVEQRNLYYAYHALALNQPRKSA